MTDPAKRESRGSRRPPQYHPACANVGSGGPGRLASRRTVSAELPDDSLEGAAAWMASKRLHDLYVDLTKVAGEVDEADARALLAELATTE